MEPSLFKYLDNGPRRRKRKRSKQVVLQMQKKMLPLLQMLFVVIIMMIRRHLIPIYKVILARPRQSWTIGASTTLDHWMARQILGLSEDTWQACLEATDTTLLTIVRDIIATRQALFPKTTLDEDQNETALIKAKEAELLIHNNKEDDVVAEGEEQKKKSGENSIEELLASLSGLKAPQGGPKKDTASSSPGWEWLEGELPSDAWPIEF
jgi:hypothetical protein